MRKPRFCLFPCYPGAAAADFGWRSKLLSYTLGGGGAWVLLRMLGPSLSFSSGPRPWIDPTGSIPLDRFGTERIFAPARLACSCFGTAYNETTRDLILWILDPRDSWHSVLSLSIALTWKWSCDGGGAWCGGDETRKERGGRTRRHHQPNRHRARPTKTLLLAPSTRVLSQ